jgi:hypothetical protein
VPGPEPQPELHGGRNAHTKVESYLKIRLQGTTWTVWSRDGTQTIYNTPVRTTPSGTSRWGQTSTIDTHGSTVSYFWACPTGDDCYPERVEFGP